jgi:hypothetical protein
MVVASCGSPCTGSNRPRPDSPLAATFATPSLARTMTYRSGVVPLTLTVIPYDLGPEGPHF